MLRDPATRRKIAIFGIVLGAIGIIGVFWAVMFGDTEWWALIVLIPVLAVMRSLARMVNTDR